MGRESVEWKIEGMEKSGAAVVAEDLFWGEELLFCCFFRLSPKRVCVGGNTAGGRASDAADRDESMSLVLNEANFCCLCLLAVLDFTDANASIGERRREKHVATASATLMITFLLLRW